MDLTVNIVICCTAIICLYHAECSETSENKISEFDVAPGGQTLNVKNDWIERKFSCNFTYQAQGGTNEKWQMKMSVNSEQTHFTCTVERPSGVSYLFFQSFRMEVYGARVAEGLVKGSGGTPLKPEEYSVDEVTNSISHVDGKFQSMMAYVELKGVRPKEEL